MPRRPASPHHESRWPQEAEQQYPRWQHHAIDHEHHCAAGDQVRCAQCAMKLPVTQEIVCPDCGARSHPPF